jgi:hypothetical protein
MVIRIVVSVPFLPRWKNEIDIAATLETAQLERPLSPELHSYGPVLQVMSVIEHSGRPTETAALQR